MSVVFSKDLSGVPLNRCLLVCLGIALLALTYSYLPSKLASAEGLPYKARNPEECVREKACVWWEFKAQLRTVNNRLGRKKRSFIYKWHQDVHFFMDAAGKEHDEIQVYISQIVDLSNTLSSYFPYKMVVDSNSNFQIAYGNDLEKTFLRYEKKLDAVLGHAGMARKLFEQAKGQLKGCVAITLSSQDPLGIGAVLIIIDVNDTNYPQCVVSKFYSSMGLTRSLMSPFNKNSHDESYTELEKFILYLLYQTDFKNKQDLQEIENTFNEIYPRVLADFNLIK